MAFLVIGQPGSFANEDANLVELKKVMILCLMVQLCTLYHYLNLHIPHASKSENMKASTSFMVSNFYFYDSLNKFLRSD